MSVLFDFVKHRQEKKDVAIGFANALDDSDGLSTIDDITITRKDDHVDVTNEFGPPSSTISGDDAIVTFDSAASSSEQPAALYEVKVKVTTNKGDVLVAYDSEGNLPVLKVVDQADTTQ